MTFWDLPRTDPSAQCPLSMETLMEEVPKHPVTPKYATKTPGGKSPLAPAQLETRVSRMTGSFLPKPEGMAGLQRPFIKMNYEPVGLSGSIWPRLGGGGPAAPLPAPPVTLFLSFPPRLLPTLLCPPPSASNEKERHQPLLEVPRARGRVQPEKIPSCKWQAPGRAGLL